MLAYLFLATTVPVVLPPAPPASYQFWLQIVTLLVAAFLTWDARRTAAQAASSVGDAKALMHELRITVDGRLTQLLASNKLADHAEGFEAGRQVAAAEAVTAATPSPAAAAVTARFERAADADAAREIRMADFTQAHANALVRESAAQPPIPVTIVSPSPIPVTIHPTPDPDTRRPETSTETHQ
jgi:hypothetical protein